MPHERDEIGAPPFVPEWVRKAILDAPTCDLCGDPVLGDDEGLTRHVVCELFEGEKP